MVTKMMIRVALVLLAGLAVLALVNRRFLIGLWRYGGQARNGTLAVGDPAPDVVLWELDGNTTRPLSDFFQGRPVVLVFGSFT